MSIEAFRAYIAATTPRLHHWAKRTCPDGHGCPPTLWNVLTGHKHGGGGGC